MTPASALPPEQDGLDARVIAVIAKTQRIPLESISPQSTFEELKIDSLDGINIVFALEEEFGVSIPDEGVQNLRSIHDAAEGVRELLRQKASQTEPTAATTPPETGPPAQ